ncbi:MAG: DegV family protein [Longimicrobiales bacterium]
MHIEYIDGARLRRAVIAGCDFVQQQRAELNRINVFPVPDGDTGTNLALTARAISDHLRTLDSDDLSFIAKEAAEGAILGARGNCGMILSHFLLGFSEHVAGQARLDARGFAGAMSAAVEHVYRSLERPVEGTIITVMREMSEEADESDTEDFIDLLEILLVRGQVALDRTPELLPQLKAAGVVDAGAKGFLHLFEGVSEYVNGDPFRPSRTPLSFDVPDIGEVTGAAAVEYSETYRFCTEALVRGTELPAADDVRAVLREFGDSMIVIRSTDMLKIHIHTDVPQDIFAYLRTTGTLVTHKAEDMSVQHAAVERAASSGHIQLARRPMSIVTDSACDLPDEIVRAHGIRVVPLQLIFESGVLLDRVDITAEQFVERLRNGEHPTTSQPTPRAFLDAFRGAAEDGELVLAVLLGSTLSGTIASARAAALKVEGTPVRIIDSLGASLTQGLLVMLASELAEMGQGPDQIAAELARVRAQSGLLFTVDVFDNLLASGRVGRGQVAIAGLLDIKPILGLDGTGQVAPQAKVRGKANVLPRMLKIVEEHVPRSANRVRFGVIHVGCADVAASVAADLRGRYPSCDVIISPATPVIATHLGPGAWGIAYQLED